MLFTCVPYLIGRLLAPPGAYYSGLLGNPDDANVYLSLMRQAHDGHWLFSDLFTSEPQRGLVLNVFWLKLGFFARVTHLSLPFVYHLARVISGWLLLMAVYCLAAQVLESVRFRRVALLLTALASGLGWLLNPGPGQPNAIDFGPGLIMPEAITFLSLLLNPLFCASMFLLVVTYLAAAHSFARGSLRAAVLAGLAALFLGNIHTYDVIPLAVVLTVYLVYLLIARRVGMRAVLTAVLIAVLASPSVIYQVWLQHTGDVSVLVKSINQFPTPQPFYVIFGLGLPFLLALFGFARAARVGNDWARLLAIWFVLGFALIYLPVGFARKLIEGLHIPICLLATLALAGWFEVAEAPMRRLAWPAAAVLILLSFPSNLFFLQRSVGDLVQNNGQERYLAVLVPPLYLSADERAAAAFLSEHARPSDIVLANSRLANYLPSLTGTTVYLGHWSETLEMGRKLGLLRAVLDASTPEANRENLVRSRGITYLVFDRTPLREDFTADDLNAGGARVFGPDYSDWLERVFLHGKVAIYRVKETGFA